MILGFLGIFAFSTLNYLGLKSISASQAGMISAGIPITILVFTPFFLEEKIKTKAWIGAIISIIGVILLIQGRQTTSSEGSLLGEIEILLSCVAWGMYTVWTVLLGILLLRERISGNTWVGGFITIFGAVLASGQRKAVKCKNI